jgi:hypothetical protein
MSNSIHPDYDYEDLPMADLDKQSPMFEKMVNELVLDAEENNSEASLWLGTLLINDQRCQVQLVITKTTVDEN